VLGARILAEIGDDRARFASARGLKAFAGTAPVTRASGTKPSLPGPAEHGDVVRLASQAGGPKAAGRPQGW